MVLGPAMANLQEYSSEYHAVKQNNNNNNNNNHAIKG